MTECVRHVPVRCATHDGNCSSSSRDGVAAGAVTGLRAVCVLGEISWGFWR